MGLRYNWYFKIQNFEGRKQFKKKDEIPIKRKINDLYL